MVLPLSIWTTGAPVPGARAARGDFFRMIQEGVGKYPGGFVDVRSTESPTYPSPREVSGVIVSGSPARLWDQEKWMLETEEALRVFFEAGVPIFGICFGHQLLAEALGGVVEPNPRGREIGTVPLTKVADDPLFDSVDDEPHIVMSHLDSVTKKPREAEVLWTTELDPHAALRFSERAWSVQFHPEMDTEIVGYYLEDRREDILAEGLDVDQILAARRESAFGRKLLARFGEFCAASASSRRGA